MDNSFVPLSKKDAQHLETNTVRIENLKNSLPYVTIVLINHVQFGIQDWYHKYKLRPGYVKEQWKNSLNCSDSSRSIMSPMFAGMPFGLLHGGIKKF